MGESTGRSASEPSSALARWYNWEAYFFNHGANIGEKERRPSANLTFLSATNKPVLLFPVTFSLTASFRLFDLCIQCR